jgi:hypothetical protein
MLLASDSRAGATVDRLVVGRNGAAIAATNAVDVSPGDTLTMALLLRNDQPLSAGIFSLGYDLGGDDELDVIAAIGWAGFPFFGPVPCPEFCIPSPPNLPPIGVTPTFVGSFGGAGSLPPAGGAFAGGYQVGTVVWQVNPGVQSDGVDILSGLFNPGVDGFVGIAFDPIDHLVLFRTATVNLVPEPGTASLVGLGLVCLVALRRRRA